MISLFLVFVLASGLEEVRSIPLQTPFNFRPLFFEVERDGDIWAADYKSSTIVKFSKDGVLLHTLAGPGNGPGELSKPRLLMSIENDKRLLVHNMNRGLISFDTEQNSYSGKVEGLINFQWLAPWEMDRYLLFFGQHRSSAHSFLVMSLDGKIHESWMDPTWLLAYFKKHESVNLFQSGLVFDKTAFFADPFYPVVWILGRGDKKPREWQLREPKFFKKIPAPLPKSKAMDQLANFTWMNSFSQLYIHALGTGHMIADWTVHNPIPNVIEVYDLKSKLMISGNINAKGRVVATVDHNVYILEQDERDEEDHWILHHRTWNQ